MAEDTTGKVNPEDLPAGDQNMMQSDAERAAAAPESDEFQLTPEIEAENLEKGKETALGKVVDNRQGQFGISGTQLVNMENLILYGPDASKKKTGYYNGNGTNFYFIQTQIKKNMSFIYPIYFMMDLKILRQELTAKYGTESANFILRSESESFINTATPLIFKGIILGDTPFDPKSKQLASRPVKYLLDSKYDIADEADTKKGLEFIRKYVVIKMIQMAKKHPERALPIYNTDGDLLWPKQMSYKEVKAFVAQRDAKKKIEDGEEKIEDTPESEE